MEEPCVPLLPNSQIMSMNSELEVLRKLRAATEIPQIPLLPNWKPRVEEVASEPPVEVAALLAGPRLPCLPIRARPARRFAPLGLAWT